MRTAIVRRREPRRAPAFRFPSRGFGCWRQHFFYGEFIGEILVAVATPRRAADLAADPFGDPTKSRSVRWGPLTIFYRIEMTTAEPLPFTDMPVAEGRSAR